MLTNPRIINEYLDMLEQIDVTEKRFQNELNNGLKHNKINQIPNLSLIQE